MDEREFDIEKSKLRHSQVKFWVGSVALAALAIFINREIKLRDLELKNIEEDNRLKLQHIEEENAHLSKFVKQVVDEDPRIRVIVAEYFQIVSQDENARQRWTDYGAVARRYLKEFQDEERKKRKELQKIQVLERQIEAAKASEAREAMKIQLKEANDRAAAAQERLRAIYPKRVDACGAENAPPCKLWERIPSCDRGLREDFEKNLCVARD